MEKLTLKVKGLSCEHCVKAVVQAVTALPGVLGASVDLKAGLATVEYDPPQASLDQIKTAIRDQGYGLDD